MTDAAPDPGTVAGSVAVVGDRRLSVAVGGDAPGESFDSETVGWSFRCASGSEIEGPWTGAPVSDLLDAADAPDATTHVEVAGADGYRVCVPVSAAIDGLLARRRDGAELPAPRFVAPGVSGVRTVKRVARIEAISLPAGADPEEREALNLGEK